MSPPYEYVIISAHDPGAVGAGSIWSDTSSNPPTLKQRNSADSGWTVVGGGGGGSSIKVVRFPIAFDTPGLVLTGVPIYVPTVGDVILYYAGVTLTLPESWDGTTPQLNLGTPTDPTGYNSLIGHFNLTNAGSVTDSLLDIRSAATDAAQFLDTTPFVAMVDDGSGGDPGCTSGTAELILLIVPA